MRKIYIAGLAIILVIAALAVGMTITGKSTGQNEIKVGFIGPLTGDFSIIGIENLRGIQLAAEEINANGGIHGKKIRLVVEDDQYLPANTVKAFEKTTSVDDIDYIMTVSYSGFLSIAPRADDRKIIVVDSLETSKEIANAGDYVFGIGIYDEGIGYTLAEFVRNNIQSEKAGIIFYNGDAFPFLVKDAFVERFEQLDGKVVSVQEYGSETKDFRSHLEKIKSSGAQAIVVIGYDEAGFAVRQAREFGMNATILAIDTTLSEGFRKNAGEAYEGIYFTSWESDDKAAEQAFVRSYQSRYAEEPQQILFVVTGYDAMRVLAKSMENSDSTDQVKANLYALRGFEGISGSLTMSEDGIVRTIEEKMYRIENGKPVRIE